MSIRFAIVSAGATLARWQVQCLDHLLALPDVQAALLIRVRAAGTALIDSQCTTVPHGARVPPPASIAALPAISLETTGGAAAEALARIRGHDLDFILSFCDGSSGADDPEHLPQLLGCARWGVWRHQFGDWTRFRDGPVGFWEVYTGQPVSTALLVRLTNDANTVIVLREGHLRTAALSPAANCAQLLASVARWPAQVCIDSRNGSASGLSAPPLASDAPRRGHPSRFQQLICSLRVFARMAGEGYRSLFRHGQWNIGIAEQPIASFLDPGRRAPVRWLPTPRRSEFRADPFGTVQDGRLTIVYELFSCVSNRGTIAAVDATGMHAADVNSAAVNAATAQRAVGTSVPVHIGPEPPVHLSYPYLIEVDGRLLCLPEAHESGELALYEVTRYPDRWRRIATLAVDKVIVDATPFFHAGYWWIAGSEPGTKGASSELHLWYAPAIVGPWLAHPGNPVKIDIRSARPAGTPFHHGGALYRPAQDCSRSYGGRVTINRVTTLSPTAFREVPIATVEPDTAGLYPEGIHTLSQVGAITLVDGKRIVFVPQEFSRNARHFLSKLWRGGRRSHATG